MKGILIGIILWSLVLATASYFRDMMPHVSISSTIGMVCVLVVGFMAFIKQVTEVG
jgi:hypothetical protein